MFSAETQQKFDREVAKYPAAQKQSAVMAALVFAQDELGWLSNDAIAAVADYLEMPAIAVYEVASFYNMYDLKPIGKYKIRCAPICPVRCPAVITPVNTCRKSLASAMARPRPTANSR